MFCWPSCNQLTEKSQHEALVGAGSLKCRRLLTFFAVGSGSLKNSPISWDVATRPRHGTRRPLRRCPSQVPPHPCLRVDRLRKLSSPWIRPSKMLTQKVSVKLRTTPEWKWNDAARAIYTKQTATNIKPGTNQYSGVLLRPTLASM